MYLHKAEASVQSTLRAATNSTITVTEVRVIVSVCEILRARVRWEMCQLWERVYLKGWTWKHPKQGFPCIRKQKYMCTKKKKN